MGEPIGPGTLPLILLTVVIQDQQAAELPHQAIAIEAYEAAALGRAPQNPDDPVMLLFAAVMAVAVLLATALHGMDAVAWAGAYRLIGAVPGSRSAMLYSLNAIIYLWP